ncbi:hypothetical protein KKA39_00275 [Patescibacteria group bacterium]|nr:hypothetical protein [Patescibacteria group bacterium]
MKRNMLLAMAVAIIASLLVPEVSVAQRNTKGDHFYALGGVYAVYNAAGKNSCSNSPALSFEVGYTPIMSKEGNLMAGIRMRPLTPYSPVTKDSSWVIDPPDSLGLGHWKKFYHKSATLLMTVGATGGKETGLGGGINTGIGLSFLEIKDVLYTCAVWDFSLQGEYNFTKKYGVFVNLTYSYLWSQNRLGKDGMAVLCGGGFKMKF